MIDWSRIQKTFYGDAIEGVDFLALHLVREVLITNDLYNLSPRDFYSRLVFYPHGRWIKLTKNFDDWWVEVYHPFPPVEEPVEEEIEPPKGFGEILYASRWNTENPYAFLWWYGRKEHDVTQGKTGQSFSFESNRDQLYWVKVSGGIDDGESTLSFAWGREDGGAGVGEPTQDIPSWVYYWAAPGMTGPLVDWPYYHDDARYIQDYRSYYHPECTVHLFQDLKFSALDRTWSGACIAETGGDIGVREYAAETTLIEDHYTEVSWEVSGYFLSEHIYVQGWGEVVELEGNFHHNTALCRQLVFHSSEYFGKYSILPTSDLYSTAHWSEVFWTGWEMTGYWEPDGEGGARFVVSTIDDTWHEAGRSERFQVFADFYDPNILHPTTPNLNMDALYSTTEADEIRWRVWSPIWTSGLKDYVIDGTWYDEEGDSTVQFWDSRDWEPGQTRQFTFLAQLPDHAGPTRYVISLTEIYQGSPASQIPHEGPIIKVGFAGSNNNTFTRFMFQEEKTELIEYVIGSHDDYGPYQYNYHNFIHNLYPGVYFNRASSQLYYPALVFTVDEGVWPPPPSVGVWIDGHYDEAEPWRF